MGRFKLLLWFEIDFFFNVIFIEDSWKRFVRSLACSKRLCKFKLMESFFDGEGEWVLMRKGRGCPLCLFQGCKLRFFVTFSLATIIKSFWGAVKFCHTVFGGLNRPGMEFLQHFYTRKPWMTWPCMTVISFKFLFACFRCCIFKG